MISVGRPEIPVGTGQPALTEALGRLNEGLVEGSSPRVSSWEDTVGVGYSVRAVGALSDGALRLCCVGVKA